jgi:hypothetical protein
MRQLLVIKPRRMGFGQQLKCPGLCLVVQVLARLAQVMKSDPSDIQQLLLDQRPAAWQSITAEQLWGQALFPPEAMHLQKQATPGDKS